MTTVFDSLPEPIRRQAKQRATELKLPANDYFLLDLIEDVGDRCRILEALILEGIASGPGIEVTDQFWDDLLDEHERAMNLVETPAIHDVSC